MHLTIFNVEHGQCALLTYDNGQRLMVDCGHNATTDWRPGDYLASQRITRLENLAITNYDEDHVSGLSNLMSKVTVQTLLFNPSVSGQQLLSLKSDTGAGPQIKLLSSVLSAGGPVTQPVLPGIDRFWNVYPRFQDENNLSMVVCLTLNGYVFIFPGDLECDGWKALLAGQPVFRERAKAANVLVASHHGRESGICPELFDAYGCNPNIIVISDDCHQYDTQKPALITDQSVKGLLTFGLRARDAY